MQILRTIKGWYGRGFNAWDGANGLDQDLVHIDNHLPNITFSGVVAAGDASSAAPAGVSGAAQLFTNGTYAVTNRNAAGNLVTYAYPAKSGVIASNGNAAFINTGTAWVNLFSLITGNSIPLTALQNGVIAADISIDGAQVSGTVASATNATIATNAINAVSLVNFTSLPTVFSGACIVVNAPHQRFMIWNGSAYQRAPWHQPGMVQYSIDNPTSIYGYLPVRGDVSYSQANYPDLVARLGLSGVGSFSLLDLRGVFVRCLDNGRIVDNGRVHASFQGDAIRNITGTLGELANIASVTATGAFTRIPKSVSNATLGSLSGSSDYSFNASLVVPTAAENRPGNTALPAWVSY